MNLEELYKKNCETPSDINQHLPTLKRYYDQCDSITEIGVRGCISLSAALASKASKVTAIDIANVAVPECDKLTFICASSLDIEIEKTDFLFIDSYHTYDQLKAELNLHAKNANKWVGFHDTYYWGVNGENGTQGLMFAINEFLEENKEWSVCYSTEINNGLTIIERK